MPPFSRSREIQRATRAPRRSRRFFLAGLALLAAQPAAAEPVSGGARTFEFVYGAPPDQFVGPFTNGDDVYVLLQGGGIGTTAGGPGNGSDGCIVDIYGELDQDGTGEAWEYTDSHAWRCGNGSLATWTAAFISSSEGEFRSMGS